MQHALILLTKLTNVCYFYLEDLLRVLKPPTALPFLITHITHRCDFVHIYYKSYDTLNVNKLKLPSILIKPGLEALEDSTATRYCRSN